VDFVKKNVDGAIKGITNIVVLLVQVMVGQQNINERQNNWMNLGKSSKRNGVLKQKRRNANVL
jgi:hypothetical protein